MDPIGFARPYDEPLWIFAKGAGVAVGLKDVHSTGYNVKPARRHTGSQAAPFGCDGLGLGYPTVFSAPMTLTFTIPFGLSS